MKIEQFEDIEVTLNPACHPCPQYGRQASGRGEP